MIHKIKKLVEEAEKFPNATIEYNCELPDDENITPTSFYGVKAVHNPDMTGVNLIYKLS